jgi:hypothetical protein
MEGEQASERAPNDARTSLQSQDRFLTALTSEYTTLQSARSTTVFESNGRVAVYLSTVSSFVVALGFIGTVSRVGQPFYLFALVLLPAVFVLGTVTYMRTIQSGIEDLLLSRAMARIRRFFSELQPGAANLFMLSTNDDAAGHMFNMGIDPGRRQLFYTAASAVLIVNGLVAGAFGALVSGGLGAPLSVSGGVGMVTGIVTVAVFLVDQSRRWRAAEEQIPPLFPTMYPDA